MSILFESEEVQISEASRRGICKLATDAEAGHMTVLRRHLSPVAAVVSYKDAQRLAALERDLTDVALVFARAATDDGRRTSLDGVLESAGYTPAQLAVLDDPA